MLPRDGLRICGHFLVQTQYTSAFILVLGMPEDTLRVEQFLASCWFCGSVSLAVAGSGSHHGQASAVDAMYQAEVQRMELAHEKSVAALEQNMTARSAFAHSLKNPRLHKSRSSLFKRLTLQYEAAHSSRPFFRIRAEDRPNRIRWLG